MSRRYDRERTVVPDHGTTGPTSSTVLESSLLGWSDKQAHILSGAGRSNDLYRAPLFPFQEDELPHYHKSRGSTHEVFQRWRQQVWGDDRWPYDPIHRCIRWHGCVRTNSKMGCIPSSFRWKVHQPRRYLSLASQFRMSAVVNRAPLCL